MKKLIFLCALLWISLFFTGCQSLSDTAIQNNMNNIVNSEGLMPEIYKRNSRYSAPDNISDNESETTPAKRASKIASVVNQMKSIERASVVVTGTSALIGIHLTDGVLDENVGVIKKEVENRALSIDSQLTHVSVTASPELMERITAIAGDIGDGAPESGVSEELSSLMTRVIPTI